MSKIQFCIFLVVAGLFSLVSGSLCAWIFSMPSAHAASSSSKEIVSAKRVEAEEFIMMDKSGNVSLELSSRKAGRPAVLLYDKKKICRAAIMLDSTDQPLFLLIDKNAKIRYRVFLDNGFPTMRFYNQFSETEWSVPFLPQHQGKKGKWPD